MNQRTFASQVEFQKYGRKGQRELFLDEMERIVPWSGLLALVMPHFAKAGNGRRPVGLEIMLRVYFVQQWFNLSDPGVEEALYESPVLQRFVGVDLGAAPAPDETTVLRFRHLLEKHDLCGRMLDAVNVHDSKRVIFPCVMEAGSMWGDLAKCPPILGGHLLGVDGYGGDVSGGDVRGQEFCYAVDGVVGDPGKDVFEVSFRVDAIELG
jgi:hypothetical protein